VLTVLPACVCTAYATVLQAAAALLVPWPRRTACPALTCQSTRLVSQRLPGEFECGLNAVEFGRIEAEHPQSQAWLLECLGESCWICCGAVRQLAALTDSRSLSCCVPPPPLPPLPPPPGRHLLTGGALIKEVNVQGHSIMPKATPTPQTPIRQPIHTRN
jgi:hypothetical protein